jgi:hypothetical protein
MRNVPDLLFLVVFAACMSAGVAAFVDYHSAREDTIGRWQKMYDDLAKSKAELSKKHAAEIAELTKTHKSELKSAGESIYECAVELEAAQLQAQPCPGPCGLPDCRVVKNMLDGFNVCLAFVQHVKATLGPQP